MNEVSKIGQSDGEPEEVIEGRIVSVYEGPMMTDLNWEAINEELNRNRNAYRADRVYVATDGEWQDIGTAGTIQYERGYGFDGSWLDEVQDFTFERRTVTTEFAWDDISDETFKLMTGYDKNVLTAANKLSDKAPIPPVDIDAVKWPGPRAKEPPRLDWL